jgi:hypothetical protein
MIKQHSASRAHRLGAPMPENREVRTHGQQKVNENVKTDRKPTTKVINTKTVQPRVLTVWALSRQKRASSERTGNKSSKSVKTCRKTQNMIKQT